MSDKFKGGLELLKPLDEACDSHEAIGLWWAGVILSARFKAPGRESPDPIRRALAIILEEQKKSDLLETQHLEVMSKIGGFATAVAHLSRTNELIVIGADYTPDATLTEAAQLADLGVLVEHNLFPYKSATLNHGSHVVGREGERSPVQQIWPPEALPPAA